MKKALLISVCLGLLVVLGGAAVVGVRLWFAYQQISLGKEAWAIESKRMQEQQQPAWHLSSTGTNSNRPSPTVIDAHHYHTEDNWLATEISREIASMAFLVTAPGKAVPDLTVSAVVNPEKPSVHVEIGGATADRLQVDLSPVFAWDAQGYTALAHQLLGNTPGLPDPGATNPQDIVERLVNLTGLEIAGEDIRVSAALQKNPGSWSDHESAALILAALALRENAGVYDDKRALLNRATAHLALARALWGEQPESWPGLLAETALLTLAGREMDALALIDSLAARPDISDADKTWLSALRLKAKGDWTATHLTSSSPLLLKIIWFQLVAHDLTDLAATRRLDPILGDGSDEPASPLPDWGRAIVAPSAELSVENSQRFAAANMELEYKELGDVLQAEGATPLDRKNLAATFTQPEGHTISTNAQGTPEVHVIGPGLFAAASRHHLLNDLKPVELGLSEGLGVKDEAEAFYNQAKIDFRGVPGFDFFQTDNFNVENFADNAAPGTYPIEEAPVGLIAQWEIDDDYALVKTFYQRPAPFGTVYEVGTRALLRRNNRQAEFYAHGGIDTNQLEKDFSRTHSFQEMDGFLKKLAVESDAHPEKYEGPPLSSTELAMLKLAPDQTELLEQGLRVQVMKPLVPDEFRQVDHLEINAVADKVLDHDMRYLQTLKDWSLSAADQEKLLRKEVVFNPDVYFQLAAIVRMDGHEDEAAQLDRKGVAQGYDDVGMSNSIRPLLLYDLNHGQQDEALAIGRKAADVYSELGLESDMIVMEKLGRFDDAEKLGHALEDRYQDNWPLKLLYVRNPGHYPAESTAQYAAYFPQGLVKADLSSFSGRPKGAMLGDSNTLTNRWGLGKTDVIVAVDGYKVESAHQYFILAGRSLDPHMDFIVYKDQKKFEEVKAYVPAPPILY